MGEFRGGALWAGHRRNDTFRELGGKARAQLVVEGLPWLWASV